MSRKGSIKWECLPVISSNLSASVLLPWSTWAIILKFLMLSTGYVDISNFSWKTEISSHKSVSLYIAYDLAFKKPNYFNNFSPEAAQAEEIKKLELSPLFKMSSFHFSHIKICIFLLLNNHELCWKVCERYYVIMCIGSCKLWFTVSCLWNY